MPPKKGDGPSKKTQDKVKAKIVEDKTFGLKNKKGAKQQKFIQQVQKQVANKGVQKNPRDLLNPNEEREKKREEEKKKKEELTQLFKPVVQTVAKGVDPKSVVCVYFKQNLCQKGDKCKFSHDLSKDRKSEKRNIYEDTRDDQAETMENWDDQKLEDVVNQKHGEDNKKKNQTQIVCKYFIEAVENKTYGWFWSCPNGDKCMYRHALPPGFTLKSEMKKKDEEDEISLEMLIEKERASLGQNVTKVTLETFLAWKARKLTEKKDERLKQEEKKRTDYKLGFVNGLTGRDLFTFNPDLIANDDINAENDIDYRRREDDDESEQNVRDIKTDFFASLAREVDDSGTIATNDRFSYMESLLKQENDQKNLRRKMKEEQEKLDMATGGNDEITNLDEEDENENEDDESEDEDENVDQDDDNDEEQTEDDVKNSLKKLIDSPNSSKSAIKKVNGAASNIEIDESLFNLEDLANIRDELEDLDLN